MKIIIIILICLFFSLTITPINEYITNPLTPQQTQPAETSPQQTQPAETSPQQIQPAGPTPTQPQSDGSLQTQVNMLSTQITTTNAIAVESKKKVDDIASQIDQLKEELKKAPDI
jgi:hypothetical protein